MQARIATANRQGKLAALLGRGSRTASCHALDEPATGRPRCAALRCAAFAPASLSALKFGKVELFDHRRSLHYPPSGQRPRASPGGAGVSPVAMPLSWHAGSPNGLVPALEHNTADRAQQPGRKCAHMAERLVFLVSPSTLDGGAAQWMELAYADAFNVRTFVLLHHLRFHELKARAESHPPFPDQVQGQPQG